MISWMHFRLSLKAAVTSPDSGVQVSGANVIYIQHSEVDVKIGQGLALRKDMCLFNLARTFKYDFK